MTPHTMLSSPPGSQPKSVKSARVRQVHQSESARSAKPTQAQSARSAKSARWMTVVTRDLRATKLEWSSDKGTASTAKAASTRSARIRQNLSRARQSAPNRSPPVLQVRHAKSASPPSPPASSPLRHVRQQSASGRGGLHNLAPHPVGQIPSRFVVLGQNVLNAQGNDSFESPVPEN
eukprot:gene11381-biopygen4992